MLMKQTVKITISIALVIAMFCVFPLNCIAYSSEESTAAWEGIEALFDKEVDIQNVCNYINGYLCTASNDINDIELCSTYASQLITSCINEYSKSEEIPSYLKDAFETISISSNSNHYRSASISKTTEYIITSAGNFKICYDEITLTKNSTFLSRVQGIGAIFEAVYSYFITNYGMTEPTTDGTYYEIHLVNDINTMGKTEYLDTPGYSYIIMNYDLYVNEIEFFRGCAAHEFMHAIQIMHNLPYNTTVATWFQESLSRAAGITYEVYYANHYDICGRHQAFLNSLSSSLGTIDNSDYRYGGSLFFLCLNDEYDQWEIIEDILSEYEYTYDLMDSIDAALDSAGSTMQSAYRRFMVYNTNPDDAYSMSPQNRMTSGYSSWGTPAYAYTFLANIGSSCSPTTTSLPYLSGHYYKIYCTSSTDVKVTVDIDYITATTGAVPDIMYGYYDEGTDAFYYIPAVVTNNTFYDTIDMSSLGISEWYLVVMNSGLSGTINYTINISGTNS